MIESRVRERTDLRAAPARPASVRMASLGTAHSRHGRSVRECAQKVSPRVRSAYLAHGQSSGGRSQSAGTVRLRGRRTHRLDQREPVPLLEGRSAEPIHLRAAGEPGLLRQPVTFRLIRFPSSRFAASSRRCSRSASPATSRYPASSASAMPHAAAQLRVRDRAVELSWPSSSANAAIAASDSCSLARVSSTIALA